MSRPSARSIVLAFALVFVSRLEGQAGRFDLEKTKSVLTGMIQKAIEERGVPSISIALVRGDSIVWKAAFGYANVRTRTPATTETIYSTGSTFKSATATAIMQLVEQGKIGLDQPVNRYLGDVQVQDRLQVDKPVTVRHILSHWSGLTAGAVTKPIWGRELPKTLDRMVAALYSVRPPESKWEYNNFAYGMAGLIVEKVSGVEYEKYMVDNVLKPLGITIAHPVYPSPEMVELMALPYNPGGPGGKPQPVAQVHFDVYPAGDIYLTAEDMARFLGAHLNGGAFQGHRILSEASIKQTHEPPFGGNYAFGWGVKKDASGHTILSHSGGIPGQSSYMMGDLDARVGVYYMSNSGAPAQIGEAALALLRGEDYTPPAAPKAITVDPKILDKYVGKYDLGEGVVTVIRQGDGIAVRPEGETSTTELFAESPTRFFMKGQDARIVFVLDDSGAVKEMVLEAGGGKTVAPRRR
jgi:CubicO group peptidase (beta-lactamase class C family)